MNQETVLKYHWCIGVAYKPYNQTGEITVETSSSS